jgi:hypothetical protein
LTSLGVGKAPKESKPQHKLEMKDGEERKDDDEEESKAEDEGDSAFGEASKSKKNKKKQIKSKQDAFKDFKNDEGKQLESDIKTNRSDLNSKKEEMGKLKDICNKSKKEIDSIKFKLDEKQKDPLIDGEKDIIDGEEDVIDEEEYNMLRQMKDHKKMYRENLDKYKTLKGDTYFIQNSIDQLKEQLVFKFEVWYDENFESPQGSKEAQKPLDKDYS